MKLNKKPDLVSFNHTMALHKCLEDCWPIISMFFQTRSSSKLILMKSERFPSLHWQQCNYHLLPQNVYKEIVNLIQLSGFVQFSEETGSLYYDTEGQIKFWFLFTFRHWSANTLIRISENILRKLKRGAWHMRTNLIGSRTSSKHAWASV